MPMPTEAQPKGANAQRTMLVARQSFTTLYEGERVEILAGASYVEASHPIAVANPDRFAPATGPAVPAGRTERYTSAPAQMTGRGTPKVKPSPAEERYALWDRPHRDLDDYPDDDYLPRPTWHLGFSAPLPRTEETPELLSTLSPTVVKLSRWALDGLQAATRACPRSHETGGLLVGSPPRGDAATKVLEAYPPGPSSLLGRSSFGLDYRTEHGKVKDSILAGHEVAVAGSWHTHPGNGTGPSTADLRVWASAWAHANNTACGLVDRYVGLIVNVEEEGGLCLTPWVIREARWGGLVAEPANLKVVER